MEKRQFQVQRLAVKVDASERLEQWKVGAVYISKLLHIQREEVILNAQRLREQRREVWPGVQVVEQVRMWIAVVELLFLEAGDTGEGAAGLVEILLPRSESGPVSALLSLEVLEVELLHAMVVLYGDTERWCFRLLA